MSTDTDHDASAGEERPLAGRALEARLVSYEDAPDELTLFPREVRAGARTTTWISARAGSFVSMDDWL